MLPKVMLIEDDVSFLTVLKETVEQRSYKVVTYWDPLQARKALQAPKEDLPAVIVSDIVMPGIDGFTFLNELNMGESTKDIPVIVITGKKNMVDLFRGLPNVFAFLEKPFSDTLLFDTLSRAVKGRPA